MTRAEDLSKTGSFVNTSGQLSLTTGVTGALPVANGGTGLTSPGTNGNVLTSNGTSWVSAAVSAGFQGGTNVTSSTDVTLTASSVQTQNINITTANRSVYLPNATTCTKGGIIFNINNTGTVPFSVRSNDNFVIANVTPFSGISLTLTDNTNAGGVWAFPNSGQFKILQLPNTGGSSVNSRVTLLSDTLGIASNSSNQVVAFTVNYSTGAFTFGTPVTLSGTGAYPYNGFVRLTDTSFIFVSISSNGSGGNDFSLIAGSVSGTTITLGSPVSLFSTSSTTSYDVGLLALSSTNVAVIAREIRNSDGFRNGRIAGATISGTTITLGSVTTSGFSASIAGVSGLCRIKNTNTIAFTSGQSPSTFGLATISGTTVSGVTWSTGNTDGGGFYMLSPADNILFLPSYFGINDPTNRVYTISGTTATLSGISVTNSPYRESRLNFWGFENFGYSTNSDGTISYVYCVYSAASSNLTFYTVPGASTNISPPYAGCSRFGFNPPTANGYLASTSGGVVTILKGFLV